VVFPFAEYFEDDAALIGTGNPPTEQGDTWQEEETSDGTVTATWSVESDTTTPGSTDYRGSITTDPSSGYRGDTDRTSLEHTGLAGKRFRWLLEFELEDLTTDGDPESRHRGGVEIHFLSDDIGGANGNQIQFLVVDDFNNNAGKLILRGPGFAGGSLGFPAADDAITVDTTGNTTYLMSFLYDGSVENPVFSGSVKNLSTGEITSDSLTFNDIDGDTPASGAYFGLGVRADVEDGGLTSVTVDFDNFGLTLLPEPGSLTLMVAGFLLLLLRGRRMSV
jgi:hypothetical protein